MSDDGRERELADAPMQEAREDRREERRDDRRPAEGSAQLKCFVGGISWHLDDAKLREGAWGLGGAPDGPAERPITARARRHGSGHAPRREIAAN